MLEIPCEKIEKLYNVLDVGDILIKDGNICMANRLISKEICELILTFCDKKHVFNKYNMLYKVYKREKKLLGLQYFKRYFEIIDIINDMYIVRGNRDIFCKDMTKLCGTTD